MSHELAFDQKTGEAALYLLKEKAWHDLGQVVSEAKTSDEVIKIAHLDWEVAKLPNTVEINGKSVKAGSYCIVRKDTGDILYSIALDRYTLVQNIQAFKFLDSLVRFKKDIIYETAGALFNGQMVFVSVKLPGYIRIAGSDDVIEMYLIWVNSHAGACLSCYFTDVRVVCNNTLSYSWKDHRNGFTMRHTSGVTKKLEDSGKLLNLVRTYNDDLGQLLNRLAKLPVTETIEKNFVNSLFMTPEELKMFANSKEGVSTKKLNIISNVRSAIHSAPGQDMHQGTGLWLYNGVTSWMQNVKTYKTKDRKLAGIMSGDEAKLAESSLKILMPMMS